MRTVQDNQETRSKWLPAMAIAGLAFGLSSCGMMDRFGSGSTPRHSYMAGVGTAAHPTKSNQALPDDVSYWDGDGVSGPPSIRIHRGQQKAYFYKGSTLVGVSGISSGNEDNGTPPGTYKITQKNKDHYSSLYGAFVDVRTGETIDSSVDIRKKKIPAGAKFAPASMPNFMRFDGAIGMHTGYLPGYAASHGCVRMPDHMATKFFENVEIGTPVIVE